MSDAHDGPAAGSRRAGDAVLTVLLIGEEAQDRAITAISLELDPAITVLAVERGLDAIAAVRGGALRIDAAILDVARSDAIGLALVKLLHRALGAATLPLIVVTAGASGEAAARYAAAGAHATLRKPFDPLTFADDVRRQLGR